MVSPSGNDIKSWPLPLLAFCHGHALYPPDSIPSMMCQPTPGGYRKAFMALFLSQFVAGARIHRRGSIQLKRTRTTLSPLKNLIFHGSSGAKGKIQEKKNPKSVATYLASNGIGYEIQKFATNPSLTKFVTRPVPITTNIAPKTRQTRQTHILSPLLHARKK